MEQKTLLITQSNYIPWKGYFDMIRSADEFVLFDDMQFTKRDWRNRNTIKTSAGKHWLTIPVNVKGKFFQKINQTEIADPAWAQNHWATICHAYRSAKCFDMYEPVIRDLYLETKTSSLSEVNRRFLEVIGAQLGIRTPMISSTEFELHPERTMRLIEICRARNATHYITGPSARAYLDEQAFADAGITIKYFDFSGYPEYPQLFGEFVHDVSVLDLLFNVGPDAPTYLERV
ncbi:MAG: WbqC family protein [Bdellovibrionota bacterium]